MEALQANITAACPLAFGGASGAVFANAVAALVAAHCAIFDDYQWPRDRSAEIIATAKDGLSFDFIVAGAGTAGSLVAGQLARKFPSLSVLLVEAGGYPRLESEVPAFVNFNLHTDSDWQYETKRDERSCLGFRNNICLWSKGKALGGSSSINVMIYLRGNPHDYNSWEQMGNTGWGYKDLLPYFEKIEKQFKFDSYKYHENPWYGIIEKAWKELEFVANDKNSNEAKIGTQIVKILTSNGTRLNTAKVNLSGLNNLHVMTHTMVQKVKIDDKSNIATGIVIRHGSGVVMEIRAAKETILSTGSIATPQILMLSGIGPVKHLENSKIKCLKDLPVGQNLHDHIILPIFLKSKLSTALSPEILTLFVLEYMLKRTGPLSNVGLTDFMGFINTNNESNPDIQFHHAFFPAKDIFLLKAYIYNYGYTNEIAASITKLNEESDLLCIFPTLLHPKSRGEVTLANSNPGSKPIIRTNYFDHPNDMKTLIKAVQFIRNLEKTQTFQALGIEVANLNLRNCTHFDEKDYWQCYMRHLTTTIYHPIGTTKMGPETDNTTVVDHDLLVHGVKKLRVVDASVMPTIPGGNTMAATLVIAEKAVDIIKKKYDHFNDEF